MDWLYVLMPIAGIKIFWPGLIILGIGVGIIGGFFGMGGAWMVTPGLNILGFPMAFAIGTDIAHMAGKSLISTMRHGKFGNVDYKLGLIMLVGTVVGFEVGAQMVMWLERIGLVELYVRLLYLVLLSLIAWMVFADVAKKKRKDREAIAAGKEVDKLSTGLDWAKTLHKIKIPPMVTFKEAQITCTAWLPIFISFATGWLAGILGIGGGLIRMPALIYFIGCPTHVAVGTDLFEVMISGLYGTGTYTYKGRTELVAAVIMLMRRGGGGPDRHRGHQVHQGLRHPHRLRPGRHRLRPVHYPQDAGLEVFPAGKPYFDGSGDGPDPGPGERHVSLYLREDGARGQGRGRGQEGSGSAAAGSR